MRGNPGEFRPWSGRIVDPVPKRDTPLRHPIGPIATFHPDNDIDIGHGLGESRGARRAELRKQSTSDENGDEVLQLYEQALDLLGSLDRLGFHQAAAHLAMALDAMRLRQPSLPEHQ